MFIPPPAQHFPTREARVKIEAEKRKYKSTGDQISTEISDRTSSNAAHSLVLSSAKVRLNANRYSKARKKRFFVQNGAKSTGTQDVVGVIPFSSRARHIASNDENQISVSGPVKSEIARLVPTEISPFEEAEQRRKARGPPKRPSRQHVPEAEVPDVVASASRFVTTHQPPPILLRPQTNEVNHAPEQLPAVRRDPVFSEATLTRAINELELEYESELEQSPSAGVRQDTLLSPTSHSAADKTLSIDMASRTAVENRRSSHQSNDSTPKASTINSSASTDSWDRSGRFIDRMKVRMALSAAQLDPHENNRLSWGRSAAHCVLDGQRDRPTTSTYRDARDPQSDALGYKFVPAQEGDVTRSSLRSRRHLIPPAPITVPTKVPMIDLPDTPTSILQTPIEMYQQRSLSKRSRFKTGRKTRRRPFAGRSRTSSRTNSLPNKPKNEELSSNDNELQRLSTVVEVTSVIDCSPPQSGLNTPRAMSIRLRGGSVLTIEPPELTAWKQSLYIHGPIKVPKPADVPRKNTVASLELFQDAVEDMPHRKQRRRSDEEVVLEDVCEWVSQFGFDPVSFDGDQFAWENMANEQMRTRAALGPDNKNVEFDRWNTPPGEAQNVGVPEWTTSHDSFELSRLSKPPPIPMPAMPPVETEESLRARGIAKVHQRSALHSRKDSLAPIPGEDYGKSCEQGRASVQATIFP